eukprot:UN13730
MGGKESCQFRLANAETFLPDHIPLNRVIRLNDAFPETNIQSHHQTIRTIYLIQTKKMYDKEYLIHDRHNRLSKKADPLQPIRYSGNLQKSSGGRRKLAETILCLSKLYSLLVRRRASI